MCASVGNKRGFSIVDARCNHEVLEKRGVYRVWWRSLRKIHNLEDSGLDRKVIIKWIFKKWNRDMDWIDQAQDRDSWRALVNVVTILRVP